MDFHLGHFAHAGCCKNGPPQSHQLQWWQIICEFPKWICRVLFFVVADVVGLDLFIAISLICHLGKGKNYVHPVEAACKTCSPWCNIFHIHQPPSSFVSATSFNLIQLLCRFFGPLEFLLPLALFLGLLSIIASSNAHWICFIVFLLAPRAQSHRKMAPDLSREWSAVPLLPEVQLLSHASFVWVLDGKLHGTNTVMEASGQHGEAFPRAIA